MKGNLFTCLIVCLYLYFCAPGPVTVQAASDLAGLDTMIGLLQEQLGRQLERMSAAREKVDSQMGLAKVRIGEQLRKSGDDLTVQIEVLNTLRDNLQAATQESNDKVNLWRDQSSQLLSKALNDVTMQISQTNELMQRLEQMRTQVDSASTAASNTTCAEQGLSQSSAADNSLAPSSPVQTSSLASPASPATFQTTSISDSSTFSVPSPDQPVVIAPSPG